MANGHDKPGTFIVIELNTNAANIKTELDSAVAQGYDVDSLTVNDNYAILYRKS